MLLCRLGINWNNPIITDNILIVHELLCSMKNNIREKMGRMAVKLNRNTIESNGHTWIYLEMFCVTTANYSIFLNGKLGTTSHHREDPLSPYLFSFCTKGLSSLLNRSEWRYTRGSGGKPIRHLFFADDKILFGRANEKNSTR